ncbi:SRPBCC domain-containing protein [Asticcacaulis sp. 201]|uniref:SRPBCC family protein n=1 Tax=Asticcacaulis sp. 201 TaxID=3028787 RepID=UPI002915F235|nr:SRPBCC domain-containing protein [Asticcacaulis sp. 201]MDV6330054.1 SRPBCC domain-containing protein [Asticcacaulis sp. 201]
MTDTQMIVVDEVFPHTAEVIWQALTSGELMARWMMPPSGFQAVEGNRFTFKTTPAGAWDGIIHCQVLELVPPTRFAYSWKGGDDGNIGYGSKLDTVVTWSLMPGEGGTRVRLVHSGFILPKNETALNNMGEGWKKILPRLSATAAETDGAK